LLNTYNNLIEVLEYDDTLIHIFVKNVQSFKIYMDDLTADDPKLLFDYEVRDQILIEYQIDDEYILYIYALENKIYILKETKSRTSRPLKSKNTFTFTIENNYKHLSIEQIGLARLAIIDKDNEAIHEIDDFLTTNPIDFNMKWPLYRGKTKARFIVVSMVHYDIYHIVLTYDYLNEEFNVFKILFNAIIDNPNLSVTIKNRNEFEITNKFTTDTAIVNFKRMNKSVPENLFGKSLVKKFKNENILAIYTINMARYFVYLQTNGVFIARSNPIRVTQHKSNLKVLSTRNNFYIFGRFTHHAFNSFQKYEYLYLRNSDHKMAKFQRPFSRIKYLKRYGYFKVPVSSLNIDERIHHNLFVGNEDKIIHNLRFKKNDEKVKTYTFRKHSDNLQILRTNLQGNITSTTIPYSEEYSLVNRIKIRAAQMVSKLFKNKNKNVNLYFEKKSNKADESGFRVFEKVMKTDTSNSVNYFILNKQSDHYPFMKEKYGSNVIEKYSFKHYLCIFNADHLIASELSNHVLNDRLFIDSLRNKIMEVPLVFLQHGIMFAKPVDNPMAFGFHKDKNSYNMYKSVISSELEAGEFFKMKYDREDLLLTGLATFDHAKLYPNADKIAFMPTYRYWEEGLIYNNNIEETTYYNTLIKVIKAFEKEGLLDKLLIVPHNKFSEHIYRNMPEYKDIISDNPSEALKVSKVFITDYSSAIYDAQYRGAYPIFYWEEKDYLIKQYKAIPPVNEENAPGPVVYSVKALVDTVKHAINNNYQLEKEYKDKYLKINQFNDGKNTDRIIEFLNSEGII
jgi:CDP-glycerol glycerophosphotransferase (TagB/SpsB family)